MNAHGRADTATNQSIIPQFTPGLINGQINTFERRVSALHTGN
jgi:hypothetical protein